MFCPKCGKQIADEARFCDGCGAQIGAAPVIPTPAPAPAPAPAPTGKKKKTGLIIGIVAGVVALLLAVFGVLVATDVIDLDGSDDEDETSGKAEKTYEGECDICGEEGKLWEVEWEGEKVKICADCKEEYEEDLDDEDDDKDDEDDDDVAGRPVVRPLPVDPDDDPKPQPGTETAREMVTVYLLHEVVYYDNGNAIYDYDDRNNVISSNQWDLEGELMIQTFYEDTDSNGMPQKISVYYGDGEIGNEEFLKYDSEGRLQEISYDGAYTGYQCYYDDRGNMTEKKYYYDGVLEETIFCDYSGNTLIAAYCEDVEGNLIFKADVEDGRVVKKTFYDYDYPYAYNYIYDSNGCLTSVEYEGDGERSPAANYSYISVEMCEEEAKYLLQQQKILLEIL